MDLAEEIAKRKERAKKFGLPVPVFVAEARAGSRAVSIGALDSRDLLPCHAAGASLRGRSARLL